MSNLFTFRFSPQGGPKAADILFSILPSQQPCEIGKAESTWLTQSHQGSSTQGFPGPSATH